MRAGQEALTALRRAARRLGVEIKLAALAADRHACRYVGHPGPEVWLDSIERTSDEKGAGAQALKALVEEADRQGALIRLYVDYADERLFDYYAQFGFERDPAGGKIMERLPKEKPAPRLEAGLRRSKP